MTDGLKQRSPSVGVCPSCGRFLIPATSHEPREIAPQASLPRPISAAVDLSATLSQRERAVFELLGYGYDNRAISHKLSISERTAKRHVTAILAKLNLESRLQAGLVALITCSR